MILKDKLVIGMVLAGFLISLSFDQIAPKVEALAYIQNSEKLEPPDTRRLEEPTVTVKVKKKAAAVRNFKIKIIHRNKTFIATVTAYCACQKCCGINANGITASGKKVKVGMVAASRGMAFGTKLKINGKIYTVEDRLSMKYDNRIDIYYSSHAAALSVGRHTMKVEVLE